MKLCVTAVDTRVKNDVDLYVQFPLFLTVLNQTCATCSLYGDQDAHLHHSIQFMVGKLL